MMSRHFNDPSADAYFTKRKWGKANQYNKQYNKLDYLQNSLMFQYKQLVFRKGCFFAYMVLRASVIVNP